jgi:hypothetical protein
MWPHVEAHAFIGWKKEAVLVCHLTMQATFISLTICAERIRAADG